MKVTEFRAICDTLGRFAINREKVTGPESKIGVQAANGILKLIAGTETAGVVVEVGQCDGRFAYVVEARPLLQSAKVLPAKEEVTLTATESALTITASGGGRVSLNAAGRLSDAGFPKKPKSFVASGSVYAEQWTQMAKMYRAVVDDDVIDKKVRDVQYVTMEFYGGSLFVNGVAWHSKAKYASFSTECQGEEHHTAVTLPFWEALKALDADGVLSAGPDGILAKAGRAECFAIPRMTQEYDQESHTVGSIIDVPPIPTLRAESLGIGFDLERRRLIEVIKAQAPHDEHNRVTLTVDTASMTVTPFGSEGGMQLPTQTYLRGVRSVNAGYLLDILNSMDAREVEVRWGNAPALSITAKEYKQWTILLAPVTLR